MERTKFLPNVSLLLLLLLANCGRLIDWGKSNFYQGEEVSLSDENVVPFIKSVTMYDQFQTIAQFDIMYLSDTVRTAYAQLHTKRMGKDEDKYLAFLRRQLEENNHYISFYVLTTHDVKLGTPESHWSLFLRIAGRDYLPFELKEVELPYEYQQLFKDHWNRFKVPYLMKFRLMDENEIPIITDLTPEISVFARSTKKESIFTWHLTEQTTQAAPTMKKNKVGQLRELRKIRRGKRRSSL